MLHYHVTELVKIMFSRDNRGMYEKVVPVPDNDLSQIPEAEICNKYSLSFN